MCKTMFTYKLLFCKKIHIHTMLADMRSQDKLLCFNPALSIKQKSTSELVINARKTVQSLCFHRYIVILPSVNNC